MDILPSGNIFRELQIIHDTGCFSSESSIEDQWQQTKPRTTNAKRAPKGEGTVERGSLLLKVGLNYSIKMTVVSGRRQSSSSSSSSSSSAATSSSLYLSSSSGDLTKTCTIGLDDCGSNWQHQRKESKRCLMLLVEAHNAV
ncbi:uncharacterized protein LOC131434184 [Malaya genurostris]|uniref:uncharacterized protein LOC131434184 n=1 Tax=Malaya genurostris TaxID=325434 RepID=UPI0026F3C474|nr:uncharacterized protein LOC131434184 [Malaya genurostris]